MGLNVGPGLADQAKNAGDELWRDSTFGTNRDGSGWEVGYGCQGWYASGQPAGQGGAWVNAGPLDYPVPPL